MRPGTHSQAKHQRISVPGISFAVLFLFGCLTLTFLFVWLSPASSPAKMLSVLLLALGWFMRTTVVSVSSWNSLLVISNGARDFYVPAQDIVDAKLGFGVGPFNWLSIAYRKSFLGLSWTGRARTLVWKETAADTLAEITSLLHDRKEASFTAESK